MDNGEQADENSNARTTPAAGALALTVELGKARFHAEGKGALVLDAFQNFRDFYGDHAQVGAADASGAEEDVLQDGDGSTGTAAATPAEKKRTPPSGDAVPLSVFLDSKKLPRGNAAIALGIAVWAKRYRSEETVDADTMKAHWRISKRKVPANIGRDLGTAASEGWLERLPALGKYSVTGYGEKAFDDFSEPDA
jgi:hypothetical protein